MIACWSCHKEAGPSPFCSACGELQPARPRDAFQVFDLSPRYHLDLAVLEKSWRERSKKLHPDKFVRAGARQRRFALEQTTLLNQAYKELKSPLARAELILRSNGYSTPTAEAGKAGAGEKLPLEFYEEVMVDREALDEAKAEGPEAVQALASQVLTRRDATLAIIDRAFADWERSGDAAALGPAEPELAKLRYYARFVDEVEGRPHD